MSAPSADVTQRPTHSRQGSIQDRTKLQMRSSPTLAQSPIDYTVIIRLPFARHDFVDPDQVEWDSVKDKALWKIISKGSDMRDLDWEDIASRFDVSLAFLMKQAAWLYERHFAGVRKQMQRLATASTPSPVPSVKIQDDNNKVPSLNTADSLLNRRGSKRLQQGLLPRLQDSPVAVKPQAPPFSRTPSSATITQSKQSTAERPSSQRYLGTSGTKPASPRQQQLELSGSLDAVRDDPAHVSRRVTVDDDSILSRSQAFRRPPFTSKPTLGGLSSDGDVEDDEDDDDDVEPGDDDSASAGFLPFAAKQDPSATLRGAPSNTSKQDVISSTTSSSSGPRLGSISSKHREQLKKLSPRNTNRDVGSDGTPSMGSSFSDLDDAGISASALEDAVLSNMQAGGGSVASRVSGLSQAFRTQK